MTISYKQFFAAMAIAVLGFAGFAYANPSNILTPQKSAAATTTVVNLGIAPLTFQATSTALDAYSVTNASGFSFNENYLLVQRTASSTSSNLDIRYQYSLDNIDWFDANLGATTTAGVQRIDVPTSYGWLAQNTLFTGKILTVPTPVRYVRAIFTNTVASSTIWYQWQPKREVR